MKLKTEMTSEGPVNEDRLYTTFQALEHDAAMAHALMQALQQHRQSPSTLNGQTVTYTEEYVIDGVLATADRLMAAWGYTEQRAIDEALPDPWRVDDGGR